MINFKLLIQYDGTKYSGWQKQGNTTNTIQYKIESILSKYTGEEIEIHGSGRTDAGVHAMGQVANFKTNFSCTPEEIIQYLNHYLPLDIRILSVLQADTRFHARLNATEKHYRYIIDNGNVADVFSRKYATRFSTNDYLFHAARKNGRTSDHFSGHINYDISSIEKAIPFLIGKQDFKSFCDNKHMKKSTIRTIKKITLTQENGKIIFDYYGDGFLYHMVRILTGTLLEIGIGTIQPEDLPQIIESKKRSESGFTASPQGLFLMDVSYDIG